MFVDKKNYINNSQLLFSVVKALKPVLVCPVSMISEQINPTSCVQTQLSTVHLPQEREREALKEGKMKDLLTCLESR